VIAFLSEPIIGSECTQEFGVRSLFVFDVVPIDEHQQSSEKNQEFLGKKLSQEN